jgi:hypothetical protein
MEAERDVGCGVDDRVVELDPAREPLLQRPASRFVEGLPDRVNQQRVMRGVELHVGASEPLQLLDLLDEDGGDVGDEVVERRVGGA